MMVRMVKFNDEIKPEALKLLSDSFRGKDFEKLFPRLFNDGTPELSQHFALLSEKGEVIGVIANVELLACVGKHTLKASASGNVAVKEGYRGKGYLKTLFDTVDKTLVNDGFDICFLHGNRARYNFYGFEKCGVEYKFQFLKKNLMKYFRNSNKYTFINLSEHNEFIEKATSIYNAQLLHIERKTVDFLNVLKSQVRNAIGVLCNGELIGSLSYGEEIMDHFSFADSEHFGEILLAFMEYENIDCLNFGIPNADNSLLCECMKYCDSYSVVNPANFKIVNFANVVRAFLQLKADNIGLCDGSFTLRSSLFGTYEICCENNTVRVEPYDGKADFLLEGYDIYDFLFSYTPKQYGEFNATASAWLPIPLYLPYMA